MDSNSNKIFDRKLADDINHDDYDKLPIENFGKEMLLRMGWKENQPLKKSGPIEPIVFKQRNFRLGLGAEPLEDERKKIKVHKGTKKSQKNSCYGIKVKIVSGKHKGLKGKIVDKDLDFEYLNKIIKFKKKEILYVELKINKQTVKVEADKIKLRTSSNDEKKSDSKSKSRSRSSSISLKKKDKKSFGKEIPKDSNNFTESTKNLSNIEDGKQSNKKLHKTLTWVHQNILVRIVSKNSLYYNTKAVVVDLLDLYSFSLFTLKDKTLHNNFIEDDIETVIPKLNEEVTILVGEHRGETGKILERDKKKNKVFVQIMNDFSIVEYTQDDVAATSSINL